MSGYEFGASEDRVLGGSATWCVVLAVVHLAQGAFSVASSPTLDRIAAAAFHVGIAVVLLLAAGAMRRVVTTRGRDVEHLVSALDRLGTLFVIRIVLLCLTFVALAVGALAAALFLVSLLD
jgi:hypothetical protein